MSDRPRIWALVAFLLGVGVAIAWTGAAELAGVARAISRREVATGVGRGPFYGLLAGVAMTALGAVVLVTDVLGVKAGPRTIRALGIGLVAAVVLLAAAPASGERLITGRLRAVGYAPCPAHGRGRGRGRTWTPPGHACPPAVD